MICPRSHIQAISPRHRLASTGFTIIEMMITVSVLAVIAVIAIPSLYGLIQDNRVASAKAEFVAALQYARSEAMTRGVPVTVKARSTTVGQEFSEEGWDVQFTNASSVTTTLRTHGPLNNLVLGFAGSTPRYTFDVRGFVTALPSNGSAPLILCAPGRGKQFLINVLGSGQIDVQEGVDSGSASACA